MRMFQKQTHLNVAKWPLDLISKYRNIITEAQFD